MTHTEEERKTLIDLCSRLLNDLVLSIEDSEDIETANRQPLVIEARAFLASLV